MATSDARAVVALVERDDELALIRRLVAGTVAGTAAVVEIAGGSGVGRTSLVAAAVGLAEEAGLRVLYARGSPAEAGLTAGVASAFLSRLSPESPDPAQAGVPPAGLCQPFLYAARRAPLMLALDDTHWIDEYSRQWLVALLRRMGEAPLLIVFVAGLSARLREVVGADERGSAVEAGVEWHLLRLPPISADGVRRLLAEAGRAEPEDTFVDHVMVRTGGLPALVRPVTEALRWGEFPATAEHTPSLDAHLRVNALDWNDDLVADLSADQLALVRAIAVCDGDFDWELVVSLARLHDGSVSRTVEALFAKGVLLAGDPPRLPCPFTHERVLAQMTPAEREELFARAAELGHRAAITWTGLARLLLSAPAVGQPWAVRVLREEAARVSADGQSETAARLLARALREPVDETTRADLLIELASAEVLHLPDRSDLRLAQVLAGPDSERVWPARLLALDLMLARGNTESLQDAVSAALRSPTLSASDRTALEGLHWLAVDGPYDALPPVLPAPPLPDLPGDPVRSAAVAWQLLVRGHDLARTLALAHAALAPGAGQDAPLSPRIIASRVLLLSDDMAEAEAGLDAVLIDARLRHARTASAWAWLIRSNLNLRNGRLAAAAADLDRALATLPLRCWHPMAQPGVLAVQAALHLEAGEFDRVAELLATELPPYVESGLGWSQLLLAKGVLGLLTGEPEAAVEHLQEAGRRMLARQWVNPALAGWRSFAALAHRACGNAAEAERLVTEERVLAQRWGSPSALGGAQLAASMVLPGQRGQSSLEAAVDVLRASPSRLRYAKALVQLASVRHAAGESGEALRLATEAGELARANGAHDLAGQARALGWDPLRTSPSGPGHRHGP